MSTAQEQGEAVLGPSALQQEPPKFWGDRESPAVCREANKYNSGRKNKGEAVLAPSPLQQEPPKFWGDRESPAVCRAVGPKNSGRKNKGEAVLAPSPLQQEHPKFGVIGSLQRFVAKRPEIKNGRAG